MNGNKMGNMANHTHASACPGCGRRPEKSQNSAQFDMHPDLRGSVYWTVRCKAHPEMFAQGKTVIVAIYNWERRVRQWRDEMTRPRTAHWLGFNIENRKLEDL